MNLLSRETSLYLRQHAENPVHWLPWGDAAFEKARAENKPILLSIGYSACHWCHVMAHESFEDNATAALMNAHFVNIKLDREERPDIDAVYQQALALMGEPGGWPLTMFLTPELKPFWGGTYFPPEPAHGLPSFKNVLSALAQGWRQDQDKILDNTLKMTAALYSLQKSETGAANLAPSANSVLGQIDVVNGGLKGDQKFPALPLFDFLWSYHIRHDNDAAKTAAIDSLVAMCAHGLRDHIGGGFFRYCVDDAWHMPHFEKMLNDQALFLSLLSEVVREVPNPLFLDSIRETTSFLNREMRVHHGGLFAFASSLDADSDGIEGGYYLADMGALSPEDAAAVTAHYELPHLYPRHAVEKGDREYLRDLLFKAREHKTPPARDEKILADANGRAICGLVAAFIALGDQTHLNDARTVFDFICTHMMQPDRRIAHSFSHGTCQDISFADDYIHVAMAALALYQATGESRYLTAACNWADILITDFLDSDDGGLFMTAADHAIFGLRIKSASDTAVSGTNAAAAELLLTLAQVTETIAFGTAAERILKLYAGDAGRFPSSHGAMLKAQMLAARPLMLSVAEGDHAKLLDILQHLSVPGLIIHPDAGTTMICAGRACKPISDIMTLKDDLIRHRHDTHVANDS